MPLIPGHIARQIQTEFVRGDLQRGHFVQFADHDGGVEGFREVVKVVGWQPKYGTFEHSLSPNWITVTYADETVEDRVRDTGHEIWASGPRPMVGGEA